MVGIGYLPISLVVIGPQSKNLVKENTRNPLVSMFRVKTHQLYNKPGYMQWGTGRASKVMILGKKRRLASQIEQIKNASSIETGAQITKK